MTKEQEAIEKCKEIIQQNKEIVKQARLSKDTNAIELTANCNKESIAIETVLNMLKEKDKEIKKKDKIIDLLVNKLNQDCKVFENGEIKEIVEIYEKIKSTSDLRGIELRKECIKQYFERKATNDG